MKSALRFAFYALTVNLIALPVFAVSCFKIDEQKSAVVPSYIWLTKQICIENLEVTSSADQTQVKLVGSYEIRTKDYPHSIRRELNFEKTLSQAYKGYHRVLQVNLDNSDSLTHYWYSRASLEFRGDLAKPTVEIHSEVAEHWKSNDRREYKIVYSLEESPSLLE